MDCTVRTMHKRVIVFISEYVHRHKHSSTALTSSAITPSAITPSAITAITPSAITP